MKVKYSIIAPCYNEQEAIPLFYEAMVPVMEQLKETFEIIFVNDGSKDNTLFVMNSLAEKDSRVRIVNFARNFGQQAAIFCGLEYASGEAVICIDVDLQDPVEVVPQMIEKWKDGFEVVHGRRTKRKGESWFKKLTSKIYLKFIKRVSRLDIPQNVGEFKLLDRKVVNTINRMPEHDRYLRGLVAWMGFKQTYVDFERKGRVAGQTKYTLGKLFRLAGNGIISYTTWPLTFAMRIGIVVSFLSIAAFITFITFAVCGITLPLVAWLFPTVTLCFGITGVLLGFNNIYFKRIYMETQNRPRYIVSNTVNIDKG